MSGSVGTVNHMDDHRELKYGSKERRKSTKAENVPNLPNISMMLSVDHGDGSGPRVIPDVNIDRDTDYKLWQVGNYDMTSFC